MSFDLYADLAGESKCPATADLPGGLAAGFVDGCTAWFATAEIGRTAATNNNQRRDFERKKNDARNCYMKQAVTARLLPEEVAKLLDPRVRIPQPGWLAIEVSFTLQTPWYSKDDRPFHVLDNPVRKDRVFGVPYMSAASWKGLLRWALGMTTGLIGPTPIEDKEKRKEAEATILHLFGNEKAATDEFQRGALAFYPTWFPRVGFEVINPHSRKTRAGTQPIYYEVVPARYEKDGAKADTKAALRLLYAPLPGQAARDHVDPKDALRKLIDTIEKLLTVYGFSAKRTAGWGLATIDEWEARGGAGSKRGSRDDVTAALAQLLRATEARP
ncbi:MAG: hypothetical protein Kow00129_03090 [Thermoleophilia bacterium]